MTVSFLTMITSAIEGNQRIGGVSIEELKQAVFDITTWFKKKKLVKEIIPATQSDFEVLAKIIGKSVPNSIKTVLLDIDVEIWIFEKKIHSVKDVEDIITRLDRCSKWKDFLLPFASDDSSFLVIDLAHDEVVYEWNESDGLSDEPVSNSIINYIETYRNILLEGHHEFIEDLGVVESVSGNHSRK